MGSSEGLDENKRKAVRAFEFVTNCKNLKYRPINQKDDELTWKIFETFILKTANFLKDTTSCSELNISKTILNFYSII